MSERRSSAPKRASTRPGRRPTRPRTLAERGQGKRHDHRRMHEATWSREDAIAVLESAERRLTQDPNRLWSRVGLRRGEVVVDVGAGSGFYSFPAAERVGPAGRVFAVDVSEELVELLRERAEAMKVGNVEPLLSAPAHIPLDDAVADVALLANVFHGIPPKTVDEAVRVLRPGGRFVDVDWKKQSTPEGPPVRHRLSASEAMRALSAHGLTPVRSFDLGPYHYVLVLERPTPAQRPSRLVSSE